MAPLINLELSLFFSQKDEVITLQPFVSLSFFQHGGVSLVGKHSPVCLCFVMPEDGEIIKMSFFCSHVNVFRMTAVFFGRGGGGLRKQRCSPPHPLYSSSSLPNIFLHLHSEMKPNEACCEFGAKFISTVDGAHSELCPNCQEQLGMQTKVALH